MIANHDQFIQAIADKNKVWVRFYSKPDSGILEQAYTPLEYGLGNGLDGFNRYWLQDPAAKPGNQPFGLMPLQVLALKVLSQPTDPKPVAAAPAPVELLPPVPSPVACE